MKSITHPITGKTYKLGRRQPKTPHRFLHLRDLLRDNVLPAVTVPATTSYAAAAAPALADIYLNDQLGDCVIAAGCHIRGVTSFNAGSGVVFTADQVTQDYSAIGGYVPGDESTDQGCDENTAVEYWLNTGFPDGVKLVSAVAVDATNIEEVRLAVYLFENVLFGVALPDGWISPMPSASGFTWDVAGPSDPDNGHGFCGVDLVDGGLLIDTWGMTGMITNDAISYYASEGQRGQLFALLSPDTINRISAKSPAGYDIDDLTKYLANAGSPLNP